MLYLRGKLQNFSGVNGSYVLYSLTSISTQLTQLNTLYILVNKVSVTVCVTSYLDLPYVPEPSS